MPWATLEQLQQAESDCFIKYKPTLNCLVEGTSTTIPNNARPVTVLNINTKIQNQFCSISEAARVLDGSVQGISQAIKGKYFYKYIYAIWFTPEPISLSEFRPSIGKSAKSVILEVLATGQKMEFASVTACAIFLGITPGAVSNAIKNNKTLLKKYKVYFKN